MTEMAGMTKPEKLEWVHWLLDELDQGTPISSDNIRKARDFVEDIREDYMDDLK